jgi:hypothetical protein
MTFHTRWALRTFALGFVVEAATEAYQFVSTEGSQHAAWVGFYYIGLLTTGLGFYLIYRGRHEWTDLHRNRLRHGHRALAVAVAMFVAAAIGLGLIAYATGPSNPGGAPGWAVALVGGLVALSLGNFFLSLVLIVLALVGPVGRALAWAGFAWSLGVAGLTGLVVGEQIRTLLGDLFSNPFGLIVGFAPLAFVLSPLFVAYVLFVAAYWDAYRHLLPAGPGPQALPVGKSSSHVEGGRPPP